MVKKKIKKVKNFLFNISEDEFTREKMIEGAFIRPSIMFIAFFTFVIAIFMLLANQLKWGGSLIIASFVLNLYSIYQSLSDNKSFYKNMNLIFKFTLFLFEIVAFNWLLAILIV